jgi:excisionase family DNA binding protein
VVRARGRRNAGTDRGVTVPLLDAKQAGALLNVPASWMLAEARANRVPHVRLGRYVRFEADALERWWRARLQGPVRTYPVGEPNNVGRRRSSAPTRGPKETKTP